MLPMMKAPGQMFAAKNSTRNQAGSSKTETSDDGAKGNSHAPTCNLDRICDRLTCGLCMRECGSLPWSRVLEGDGLDVTAEDCVLLFQAIERGVQVRDNPVGVIGDDDQFEVDLFVSHLNSPVLPSYACVKNSHITGNPEIDPLLSLRLSSCAGFHAKTLEPLRAMS